MPNAKLCLLIMVTIVAACATQPNKVASAGPDVQCHSQRITGSMMTKSVCTTKAQRDLQDAELGEVRHAIDVAPAPPQGQH